MTTTRQELIAANARVTAADIALETARRALLIAEADLWHADNERDKIAKRWRDEEAGRG